MQPTQYTVRCPVEGKQGDTREWRSLADDGTSELIAGAMGRLECHRGKRQALEDLLVSMLLIAVPPPRQSLIEQIFCMKLPRPAGLPEALQQYVDGHIRLDSAASALMGIECVLCLTYAFIHHNKPRRPVDSFCALMQKGQRGMKWFALKPLAPEGIASRSYRDTNAHLGNYTQESIAIMVVLQDHINIRNSRGGLCKPRWWQRIVVVPALHPGFDPAKHILDTSTKQIAPQSMDAGAAAGQRGDHGVRSDDGSEPDPEVKQRRGIGRVLTEDESKHGADSTESKMPESDADRDSQDPGALAQDADMASGDADPMGQDAIHLSREDSSGIEWECPSSEVVMNGMFKYWFSERTDAHAISALAGGAAVYIHNTQSNVTTKRSTSGRCRLVGADMPQWDHLDFYPNGTVRAQTATGQFRTATGSRTLLSDMRIEKDSAVHLAYNGTNHFGALLTPTQHAFWVDTVDRRVLFQRTQGSKPDGCDLETNAYYTPMFEALELTHHHVSGDGFCGFRAAALALCRGVDDVIQKILQHYTDHTAQYRGLCRESQLAWADVVAEKRAMFAVTKAAAGHRLRGKDDPGAFTVYHSEHVTGAQQAGTCKCGKQLRRYITDSEQLPVIYPRGHYTYTDKGPAHTLREREFTDELKKATSEVAPPKLELVRDKSLQKGRVLAVMELCDETLRAFILGGPQRQRERWADPQKNVRGWALTIGLVLLEVINALREWQGRVGFIHRDLHTENVLLIHPTKPDDRPRSHFADVHGNQWRVPSDHPHVRVIDFADTASANGIGDPPPYPRGCLFNREHPDYLKPPRKGDVGYDIAVLLAYTADNIEVWAEDKTHFHECPVLLELLRAVKLHGTKGHACMTRTCQDDNLRPNVKWRGKGNLHHVTPVLAQARIEALVGVLGLSPSNHICVSCESRHRKPKTAAPPQQTTCQPPAATSKQTPRQTGIRGAHKPSVVFSAEARRQLGMDRRDKQQCHGGDRASSRIKGSSGVAGRALGKPKTAPPPQQGTHQPAAATCKQARRLKRARGSPKPRVVFSPAAMHQLGMDRRDKQRGHDGTSAATKRKGSAGGKGKQKQRKKLKDKQGRHSAIASTKRKHGSGGMGEAGEKQKKGRTAAATVAQAAATGKQKKRKTRKGKRKKPKTRKDKQGRNRAQAANNKRNHGSGGNSEVGGKQKKRRTAATSVAQAVATCKRVSPRKKPEGVRKPRVVFSPAARRQLAASGCLEEWTTDEEVDV